MHRALLGQSDPDIAGRWREQQVWIGGAHTSPHGATFVPPHHRHVPRAIADLVAFIDRDDVPVLAHAAIAHAQFETIHPFPDGNGRTGRALVHTHLRNKRLIRNVTVPVSAGLLTDIEAYFAALTRYRQGNPVVIVEAFANASFLAVNNGQALVNDLRDIRAAWTEKIKARRDAAVWRVVELLLRNPVVNAPLVGKELGIAPQNAYRALRPLEEVGIVIESTDKKRGQLWRAPEVLGALDHFAARAGRRRRA
jgi:Fic family protein